jgi:putative endonuclease
MKKIIVVGDDNTPQPMEKLSDTGNPWYVYLLRCADGSLYAGVSNNLQRRLRQHNGDLAGGARYTRGRRPVTLVWSEPAADRVAAQRREQAVKRLTRRQKERLIGRR